MGTRSKIISCQIPTLNVVILCTILPLLRHTYVTALTSPTNNSGDAFRLLRDVIDPFDRRVRPILNQSRPIEVSMTYNLVNLISIDEIDQRISINVWVNFSWYDEFRTWNPDDYGGNDVIHPRIDEIWLPETTLTNADGHRDVFSGTTSLLMVHSNGATRWYTGGVYTFVCAMNFKYFPYDLQTCHAKVMSDHLGSEINLEPTIPTIGTGDYITNGEWELISSHVGSVLLSPSGNDQLPFVVLTVSFKRRPLYYLMNVLVPTVCTSSMSLFGFVVPKDSGERVSFAVTVLLSLSVFMGAVSGQLPANSDTFPLISIYIFSVLSLSMLSVLIIVCQIRMVGHCSKAGKATPNVSEEGNDDDERYNKTSRTMKALHGKEREMSLYIRYLNSRKVVPQSGPIDIKPEMNYDSDATGDFEVKNEMYNDNNGDENNFRDKSKMYDHTNDMLRSLKILFLKHDDAILMIAFSTLWVIFTLVFLISFSQNS